MGNRKKKIGMIIVRFIIIILLLLLTGYIILMSFLPPGSNPHAGAVSENVEESKKIGVFIQEYKIDNIQVIDANYTFPIESVWMEKCWFHDLSKRSKEDLRTPTGIDSTESQIVFELKKTSKKDFFSKVYYKFWGLRLQSDDGYDWIIGRSPSLRSIEYEQDTIQCIIEKFQQPNERKNAIPLFTFDLLRIVDEN